MGKFIRIKHSLWGCGIGLLPLPQIYGFQKKASQTQIFRILEPLIDFIFNFKISNLGLSQKNLYGERAF